MCTRMGVPRAGSTSPPRPSWRSTSSKQNVNLLFSSPTFTTHTTTLTHLYHYCTMKYFFYFLHSNKRNKHLTWLHKLGRILFSVFWCTVYSYEFSTHFKKSLSFLIYLLITIRKQKQLSQHKIRPPRPSQSHLQFIVM